jgi:hypothetical protein
VFFVFGVVGVGGVCFELGMSWVSGCGLVWFCVGWGVRVVWGGM